MTRKPQSRPEGRFECKKADDEKSADVYVYGDIGASWFGDSIEPSAFVKAIGELDVDELRVWVNSPGGDAFGGIAMMNALRRHPAHVVVTVDGLAASAASYIALGGDELVMGRNSQLMVHDASGLCYGNASDMAEMQQVLDGISNNIAAAYAEKAGGTVDEWRGVMRAETWYSADEAVEAGLADRVDASRKKEATASFDLSIFAHAGREDAPTPRIPRHERGAARAAAHFKPPAEPDNTTPEEGADMSDTLMAGLRTRLGIPAENELNEDGVLAALDEALTERAEPTVTAQIPEGTVLVEATQLDELRRMAVDGATARAEQVAARRAGIVAKAVEEGRIAPARSDHWLAQLNADEEGATAVLATLEPGTVPLAAVGYTGGVEESSDDDKLYAAAWGSKEA